MLCANVRAQSEPRENTCGILEGRTLGAGGPFLVSKKNKTLGRQYDSTKNIIENVFGSRLWPGTLAACIPFRRKLGCGGRGGGRAARSRGSTARLSSVASVLFYFFK